MPTETYTLVGMGVAAIVVIWLVFSVAKKLFGLLLVGALIAVGVVAWQHPELLQQAMDTGLGLVNARR